MSNSLQAPWTVALKLPNPFWSSSEFAFVGCDYLQIFSPSPYVVFSVLFMVSFARVKYLWYIVHLESGRVSPPTLLFSSKLFLLFWALYFHLIIESSCSFSNKGYPLSAECDSVDSINQFEKIKILVLWLF